MKTQCISKIAVLGLLIVGGINVAQAQITERQKANIPFSFYVGNKELPAGEYIVEVKDPVMGLMKIASVEGKASAMFITYNTQLNKVPGQGELMFDQYGDRYFLEKIFEQGDRNGNELIQSKLEKEMEKEGEAVETEVTVE